MLITVSFQFIKYFKIWGNHWCQFILCYFIFLKSKSKNHQHWLFFENLKELAAFMSEPSRTCSFVDGYFVSQVFSEPWLYIRTHSSIFFWEPWLSTKEPCQWQLDLILYVMTTKAYFYFYFSVWFKAFEKIWNQRTTHSGYLKILKELVGFVKEP